MWRAPSQSRGPVGLPPDAAIQQQPQPVVGEVAEAVPDPLDLLDEQVHGLGGPVGTALGRVEGEDLGFPGPDSAGKPRQLRHPDAVRPAVEALQRGPGVGQVADGIDRTQQLLALPGRGDLTARTSSRQAGPQPHLSPLVELLCRHEQQLANAVQRVCLRPCLRTAEKASLTT